MTDAPVPAIDDAAGRDYGPPEFGYRLARLCAGRIRGTAVPQRRLPIVS